MNTVYIDIETAPQGWETYAAAAKEGRPPPFALRHHLEQLAQKSPPANYGAEAQMKWWAKQQAQAEAEAAKWYLKRSLDSKLGQVVCVGVAWNDRPPECLWLATERETLEWLAGYLDQVQGQRIVANNGMRFDFPFLWERAVGYGMWDLAQWFAVPKYGAARSADRYPRCTLVDPKEFWGATDVSASRMGDCLRLIGADIPNPIDASQVLDCLLEDRRNLIEEHVLADVESVRAIWQAAARGCGVEL